MFLRIFLVFTWLCISLGPALAQHKTPEPELRVLSYNIQMLPRWIAHLGHRPLLRARLIPEKLIADSIDVIVFQEAFDKKCMRIIRSLLIGKYPYVAGPANDRKAGMKLNSGVMMFSRIPLKFVDQIDFRECEKEDCFARKGALLAEAEWQGKSIQIMGTHMEAGGTPELKTSQFMEINEMIRRHAREGVPQLLCGDFNIRKGSELYQTMLQTIGMEDGPLSGELQYTADHKLNDMCSYNPEDRKVIDFIFYRANGAPALFTDREVKRYRQRWNKKREDLSDHMALLMRLRF